MAMSKGKKWLILAAIVALVAVPVVMRGNRGGEVKQVEIETVGKKVISPDCPRLRQPSPTRPRSAWSRK